MASCDRAGNRPVEDFFGAMGTAEDFLNRLYSGTGSLHRKRPQRI